MDADGTMFQVSQSLRVHAPADRMFLLATSIPLVEKILGMRPVAGQTTGLVERGSTVTWRGWKFGLPTTHVTLISAYDRPRCFRDTMVQGRFRRFFHDHEFVPVDSSGAADAGGVPDITEMRDVVHFSLPFGVLGWAVGRYIVAPYVLKLVNRRFAMLQQIAEGPDWARWLNGVQPGDPE